MERRPTWWELNRDDIRDVLKGWIRALLIIVAVIAALLLLRFYWQWQSGPQGPPATDPPAVCGDRGVGYC